jgi:Rrf2 family protein
MIFLALEHGDSPTRIHEIAAAEGIPSAYAEQILMKLKGAGLVRSHRGAKGGYTLVRPPDEITVADVLGATEGPMGLAPCLTTKCSKAPQCPTKALWQEASECLRKTFSGKTIGELVADSRAMQVVGEPTFDI